MKRLYPLLFISVLIYWSCEDSKEEDTEKPTVTITYPQNGSTVYEIITITCISSDNEGVDKVELWVNGVTTGLTDNSEPYSFDWNTTTLDDGNYTITIRSYDTSDNTTDSEPVVLTVDNSLSVPQGGNVTSISYTITEMTVEWEQSSDGDFKNYKLLYSETESGNKDTIQTYTDKTITSYTITEFDPLIENWFYVQVTDTLGFSSIGTGMTNEIESTPPTTSVLYPITYNDGFQISWSQNNDDDFGSYKLYESLYEDMNYQTLLFETTDRTVITYLKTTLNYMYYQIVVEDVWGVQSTSDIEFGDYSIELWGEVYSVGNTYELYLSNNGLTGSIPPEIGNLTNLTYLDLHNNQLTGSIPPEIGNLTNLTTLNLNSNDLTGEIPSEIGILTNLTYLSLYTNNLSGEIPTELGDLSNLEWFFLSDNQLTGSIPPEIWNLTNLERLSLMDNQLTGPISPEIGNLTNLERLYLSNNQLTSIPLEIGNLTNLNFLKLQSNQLTGEIPESICDLNIEFSNSDYFNISTNQLCPPYPSCVEDYVGEQNLSNCEGFVELWGVVYSVENTTELDLSNVNLTGPIPPEIGNLTNLVRLDLHNNQLTGSIPPEIGNLTNLTELYFENNELTGSIPPEIGNLTNLEKLYLYLNQLTGEIPESICDLNIDWSGNFYGISYFSISNNQLCPPYPSCIEDYVGEQDTSGCD